MSRNSRMQSTQSRNARRYRDDDLDYVDYPDTAERYRASSGYYSSGAGRGQSVSSQYSRRATQAEYSRIRAKKAKRRKILTGIFGTLIALVVVAAVAAGGYVWVINNNLHRGISSGDLNMALDTSATYREPFYVLLMGVDKSEYREQSGEYGGSYRSDSIILARIDPVNKKVTLISIARDTYVNIEGVGPSKINAAHAYGGPELAVKTVSAYAGVPIAHYAEIDFDGFEAAVDALGGVEVDVPIDINDERAGGSLSAGVQTLNGEQALILCRSRHSYDDVGDGDVYRAANQRMVLGAVAKKLLESDPATILNTVTAMSAYITTDMSVSDIAGLAIAMKGMDADTDIYSAMNPTVSAYENDTWYEYSNQGAWEAMMSRVDSGQSPLPNEEDAANKGGVPDGTLEKEYVAESLSGEVKPSAANADLVVWNGNGIDGAAARTAADLTAKGYNVIETASADHYGYQSTLVIYNDRDQAEAARSIAQDLGVGYATENNGRYLFTGDYLIIVGADYY